MGKSMSDTAHPVPKPGYKDYHPPFPLTWWLRDRTYFIFMMRELSCVFVLGFAVWLLTGVMALSRGASEWDAWVACATGSLCVGITSIVALCFVLLHAVTWFRAGAVVSPIKLGEFQVPTPLFVLANLGVVVIVAAIIGYFSLGG
jgi:fumarate reductase subunit C